MEFALVFWRSTNKTDVVLTEDLGTVGKITKVKWSNGSLYAARVLATGNNPHHLRALEVNEKGIIILSDEPDLKMVSYLADVPAKTSTNDGMQNSDFQPEKVRTDTATQSDSPVRYSVKTQTENETNWCETVTQTEPPEYVHTETQIETIPINISQTASRASQTESVALREFIEIGTQTENSLTRSALSQTEDESLHCASDTGAAGNHQNNVGDNSGVNTDNADNGEDASAFGDYHDENAGYDARHDRCGIDHGTRVADHDAANNDQNTDGEYNQGDKVHDGGSEHNGKDREAFWKHDGPGRQQLASGFEVFVYTKELERIVNKFKDKPTILIRRVIKLTIDEKDLLKMTLTGRGHNRLKFPTEVLDAIQQFMKNEIDPQYWLAEADIREVVTKMLNKLRE